MSNVDAADVVREFIVEQASLVRHFMSQFSPKDTLRFRDAPNGTFVLNGVSWNHRRHGSGVVFTNSGGVVINAHVAMAAHPAAVDGGRLFEYAESRGIRA